MADGPIEPDETAFTLTLNRRQLKILYTALQSYYDDLGHEEIDLDEICKSIFAELPSEDEIRAIDLNLEP